MESKRNSGSAQKELKRCSGKAVLHEGALDSHPFAGALANGGHGQLLLPEHQLDDNLVIAARLDGHRKLSDLSHARLLQELCRIVGSRVQLRGAAGVAAAVRSGLACELWAWRV